jgi:hypothetical protein
MKQQILDIVNIEFDPLFDCITRELRATNVATSILLIGTLVVPSAMWLLKAAHGTPDIHTLSLSLSFYCVKSLSLSR